MLIGVVYFWGKATSNVLRQYCWFAEFLNRYDCYKYAFSIDLLGWLSKEFQPPVSVFCEECFNNDVVTVSYN